MSALMTFLGSSALAPVMELLKNMGGAASRKWFGLSVDDQIKLQDSQTRNLQAVAALDTPGGTPSLWVINLRASFRYIAAIISILGGIACIMVGFFGTKNVALQAMMLDIGSSLIAAPFGFIFGERLTLSLRGPKNK
jgi:hypothetical protein